MVTVRVVVRGATGRVDSARVLAPHGNSIPGRCLRRAAQSLRFRRFSNATQSLTYPIILR